MLNFFKPQLEYISPEIWGPSPFEKLTTNVSYHIRTALSSVALFFHLDNLPTEGPVFLTVYCLECTGDTEGYSIHPQRFPSIKQLISWLKRQDISGSVPSDWSHFTVRAPGADYLEIALAGKFKPTCKRKFRSFLMGHGNVTVTYKTDTLVLGDFQ